MVLETPKEETSTGPMDAINLNTLRGLVERRGMKSEANRLVAELKLPC